MAKFQRAKNYSTSTPSTVNASSVGNAIKNVATGAVDELKYLGGKVIKGIKNMKPPVTRGGSHPRNKTATTSPAIGALRNKSK